MTTAKQFRLKLLIILGAGLILLAMLARCQPVVLTSIALSQVVIGPDGSNYVAGPVVGSLSNAGQGLLIPATAPTPVRLNFVSVEAVRGDATPAVCADELVISNGWAGVISWSNSDAAGTSNVLLIGHASRDYTRLVPVGTATSIAWPMPATPSLVTMSCGGVQFFAATNPAGMRWFRAHGTATAGLVTIDDSGDLVNWTNPYAILNGCTSGVINISATQIR